MAIDTKKWPTKYLYGAHTRFEPKTEPPDDHSAQWPTLAANLKSSGISGIGFLQCPTWAEIEATEGVYDWNQAQYQDASLNLIEGYGFWVATRWGKGAGGTGDWPAWAQGGGGGMPLDSKATAFQDFCEALATRYKRRFKMMCFCFELQGATTAAQYAPWFHRFCQGIHAGDPDMLTISAGMADPTNDPTWLDDIYTYYAGQGWDLSEWDAVGIHPYYGSGPGFKGRFNREFIKDIHSVMRNNGHDDGAMVAYEWGAFVADPASESEMRAQRDGFLEGFWAMTTSFHPYLRAAVLIHAIDETSDGSEQYNGIMKCWAESNPFEKKWAATALEDFEHITYPKDWGR